MERLQWLLLLPVAVILGTMPSFTAADLPSVISVCSRNDPHIGQCIDRSLDRIRPHLATGDFGENYTVPGIDPFAIRVLKLQRGADFQATFQDLLIAGTIGFKMEKISARPANLSFDLGVSLPRLNFTGKYALKMKLLFLDLAGKGGIHGTLKSTRMAFKVRGFRKLIDGQEFVRFRPIGVRIRVGTGTFQLDNLFNGDPVLGTVGNQVINENPGLFLDEIIPGMERHLSDVLTEVANGILETTTFDEMFPDE